MAVKLKGKKNKENMEVITASLAIVMMTVVVVVVVVVVAWIRNLHNPSFPLNCIHSQHPFFHSLRKQHSPLYLSPMTTVLSSHGNEGLPAITSLHRTIASPASACHHLRATCLNHWPNSRHSTDGLTPITHSHYPLTDHYRNTYHVKLSPLLL